MSDVPPVRQHALTAAAATAGVVALVALIDASTVAQGAARLFWRHPTRVLFFIAVATALTPLLTRTHVGSRLHRAVDSRGGATTLFVISVLAFMSVPLLSWHHEIWSYNSVAGILPWSDSSDYHRGALQFIQEGSIDPWNQRRPINALAYVVRLGITGGDFWLATLLQAAFAGSAVYVLATRLADTAGVAGALACLASLFPYVEPYVGLTSSESLGFVLAITGFALLWSGGAPGDSVPVMAGIGLVTVSQLARPGALFVIPLLVVWAAFTRSEQAFSLRRVAQGAASVAAALIVIATASSYYGAGGGGTPMGNFSHTLYGVAHGGAGWSLAEERHPPGAYRDQSAQQRAIFEAALEQIRNEPLQLGRGLAAGTTAFVRAGGPFGFLPGRSLPLLWTVLGVLGTVVLWHRGQRVQVGLLLVGWVAVALSAPVLFQDGGYRAFISTAPFFAVPAGVGFALGPLAARRLLDGRRLWPLNLHEGRMATHHRSDRLLAVGLSAGIAGAIVLAPGLVSWTMRMDKTHAVPTCPGDEWPIVAQVARTSAHISVVESGPDTGRTEVDMSSLQARRGSGGPKLAAVVSHLRPGDVLAWSYNLTRDSFRPGYRTILLAAPVADQLRDASGTVLVKGCGRTLVKDLGAYRVDDVH